MVPWAFVPGSHVSTVMTSLTVIVAEALLLVVSVAVAVS